MTSALAFANFLEHHGPNAVVLFVIDAHGRLRVHTTEEHAPSKHDLKVIALVDPVEPAA
jgi:hypothetical protein